MDDTTPTINFDLPGVGLVTMIGEGPWHVIGADHAQQIKDSNGQDANPTVVQRFSGTTTKPNRNVVFAQVSTTAEIVRRANAELEAVVGA